MSRLGRGEAEEGGRGDLVPVSVGVLLVRSRIEGGSAAAAALLVRSGLGEMGILPDRLAGAVVDEEAVSPATDLR